MEIEGLDDFELDFQTYSDFPRSWNGHVINWMTHLRSALHEKIDRFPRSLSRSLIGKWIQPKSSPTWAGAKRCVDFYLGQKIPKQEKVAETGYYVISGRISLSELLAPDYLDKPFQIVPFPVSIWDNAPLIIIPEGISPEIFTNSLPFILPPLNLY